MINKIVCERWWADGKANVSITKLNKSTVTGHIIPYF